MGKTVKKSAEVGRRERESERDGGIENERQGSYMYTK